MDDFIDENDQAENVNCPDGVDTFDICDYEKCDQPQPPLETVVSDPPPTERPNEFSSAQYDDSEQQQQLPNEAPPMPTEPHQPSTEAPPFDFNHRLSPSEDGREHNLALSRHQNTSTDSNRHVICNSFNSFHLNEHTHKPKPEPTAPFQPITKP